MFEEMGFKVDRSSSKYKRFRLRVLGMASSPCTIMIHLIVLVSFIFKVTNICLYLPNRIERASRSVICVAQNKEGKLKS